MDHRRRVVWSPEAQASLDEILAYVSRTSPDGAVRIMDQAFAAADSLATLSERGRVVPEYEDPMIREIFVFRFRMMYRVFETKVQIVTIIHGARDFDEWRKNP